MGDEGAGDGEGREGGGGLRKLSVEILDRKK